MRELLNMQEAAAEKNFYWKLFKSTFVISAFTIGGGFVIIPLLKAKFVDEYKWLDDKDALNLVAIAQSAPGVVAANSAIILGYRMGGLLGTLVALLATILPPLITLTLISYAYDSFAHNQYIQLLLKGMQCGATAIIINVAIDLLRKELKKKLPLPLVIIAGTFIANYFFNVNLMYAVIVDAIIGFFLLRDKKYA
jgi:chromate transporter